MVWFFLACQNEDSVPSCAPGYKDGGEGHCLREDETGDDSGGRTDDSGEGPTGLTLGSTCAPPSTLPDDPIVGLWSTDFTGVPGGGLIELVDLELTEAWVYGVGQGGLTVVSRGATPEPMAVFTGEGRYHRVEVLAEPYVALTNRETGLSIVDLSDPRSGREVAKLQHAGWEGLAADGSTLYVAARDAGLVVLDVSDPEQPVVLAEVAGLAATWEIVGPIEGYLYAADSSLGVVPIDVSDPQRPVMGTPVPVEGLLHLAVEGDFLYGAAGSSGLVVLDRADPAAPVVVASASTGGSAVSVAVSAGLVHVADHESISSFDVSNPREPLPLGRELAAEFALAVAADGDEVWVGDWGILEAWRVDGAVVAGELDVLASAVVVDAAGSGTLTLTNRGAGTLTLYAASATDGSISFSVDDLRLAPGAETTLHVQASAGVEVDTDLCLVSDDPDSPLTTIPIVSGEPDPLVGQVAPDFVLFDTNGQSHQLSELLGHPVVLAYFATW